MKYHWLAAVVLCGSAVSVNAQLPVSPRSPPAQVQQQPLSTESRQRQPPSAESDQCAKVPELQRQCDAAKASGSTTGIMTFCKPLTWRGAGCRHQ